MDKICVLKGEQLQLIRESQTSKVARKFGVGKTIANLQRYVYWPKMQKKVAGFIRGCMICCTSKYINTKLGLYHPLPIPTPPWESISMDFVGGLPTTKKGHDYLFVVVDRFIKMCVLTSDALLKDHQQTKNNKLVLRTGLGALWDTKEPHFRYGYKICQCILDYIVGEDGCEVREVYYIIHIKS